MGKPKQAEMHFRSRLQLAKEIQDQDGIHLAYHNLGALAVQRMAGGAGGKEHRDGGMMALAMGGGTGGARVGSSLGSSLGSVSSCSTMLEMEP